MSLRLVSRSGSPRSCLANGAMTKREPVLEGPAAREVLLEVFRSSPEDKRPAFLSTGANGLPSSGFSPTQQQLQSELDRELGQYLPADKTLKLRLFEQLCIAEGNTLFLSADWLGNEGSSNMDPAAVDIKVKTNNLYFYIRQVLFLVEIA